MTDHATDVRRRKEADYLGRELVGPSTPLDLALTGRDLAAKALTGSGYMAFEDYECGLVDALTNLLHFARRYDIDFEAELGIARRHHEYEARTPWDEEIPS